MTVKTTHRTATEVIMPTFCRHSLFGAYAAYISTKSAIAVAYMPIVDANRPAIHPQCSPLAQDSLHANARSKTMII